MQENFNFNPLCPSRREEMRTNIDFTIFFVSPRRMSQTIVFSTKTSCPNNKNVK